MTRLEFDDLVDRLESRFRNRTPALTRTAVGWAVLGYIALALGLLLSLGIVAGCVWAVIASPGVATIKLGLIFGLAALAIGISIVRGAWVRLNPPEGRRITRTEVPRLFDLIDEISDKAGGVRFGDVVLTDELNASVVQVPRLGIFGWHKAYLSLGLPLLDALSPDEFKAVLAHEFAHLSRSHGRTGNWLYRIRQTWASIAESLATQGGMLVRPFQAFFSWFWPRFNARAFVLSRHNEYEADAFAASSTSPAIATRALQRIACEARRLEEGFWNSVSRRAVLEPEPPGSLFADLSAFLKSPADPGRASHWLGEAFAMKTGTSDTHPGLADRLSALGLAPGAGLLPPVETSASDDLLGPEFASEARDHFSQSWIDTHGPSWKERFEEGEKLRQRIEELRNAEPTLANRRELLQSRIQIEGIATLRADVEAWLAEHPDEHHARYLLGSHLLSEGDPAGLEHLEAVASADPAGTLVCLDEMAAFHDRNGNHQAIRDLKLRADQHDELVEQALGERNKVGKDDSFEAHGLSDENLAACQAVLAKETEVATAWIVRKLTRLWPQWPHYVVVLRVKPPTLKLWTDEHTANLLQHVATELPIDGYLLVINDQGPNRQAAKRIKSLEGAKFYTKDPA